MLSPMGPIISVFLLICIAASIGAYPIKKLIRIQEAKHELKHGSPGFFRTMSGWIVIAVWVAATWFFATIIGDWWATDDLSAAINRSWRRLELLLRILEALADD